MSDSSSPILLHRPVIKVNGTAQTNLIYQLVEVVVDTAVFLPGTFSLLINDPQMTYIADGGIFQLGTEVSVCVEIDENGTASDPLITGIVTGLEAEISHQGQSQFRVWGYDKSIKLTQGKHTDTYLNMSDADIVSKIAGLGGLSPDVGSAIVTYPHLIHNNISYWDFVVDLAKRNGCLVSSNGTNLTYKKPSSLSIAATLDCGLDLISFRPRLSVLGQVQDVKTNAYDTKTKAAITGTKSNGSGSNFQSTSKSSGGSAANTALSVELHNPVDDLALNVVSAANAVSEAQLMQRESRFVQAEGVCLGNPAIQAGKAVTITGAGTLFSANYFVTQARHVITEGEYTVDFNANGYQPETIQSLLQPDAPATQQMHSVVIGVVTNDKDSEDLGRVKVKYPWLINDSSLEVESDWAQVAILGGVKSRAIGFVPGVNDEVLVMFLQGDINSPIVLGTLWNSTDAVPSGMAGSDHAVQKRVIQSMSGHVITLSDESGSELLSIASKSGHIITLDDKGGSEKVTVKDKTGNNSITIDSASNAITMNSAGKLEIKATGDLVLTSQGAIKLTSTGAMNLSGGAGMGKLDLTSSSTALQGIKVDVTGQTQTAVKGNAMVEIQGGLVKIN